MRDDYEFAACAKDLAKVTVARFMYSHSSEVEATHCGVRIGVTKLLFLVFAALQCVDSACLKQNKDNTAKLKTVRTDPESTKRAEQEPQKSSDMKKKILPKWSQERKKRYIVGGCDDFCGNAKEAFRNFIRALLLENSEDLPPVIRFIDTSQLKADGEKLGEKWANMWLLGQKEERRESIAKWLSHFRDKIGFAVDPVQLEESLEVSTEFSRISSTEVEFKYAPPRLTYYSGNGRWRIVLGLRGLEWLVREFEQVPD